MSEDNEDTTGYVLAEDYAPATFKTVEEVTEQLKNGTLKGRVINNSWYVKSSLKLKRTEDIAAESRANIEASAKAGKDFMKSIKPVQVIGISIPFEDVLSLTFQAFCASLIIAIPIGLLLVVINS